MRRKAGDLNPIVVIWLKLKANTVAAPHRNLTCFPIQWDYLITRYCVLIASILLHIVFEVNKEAVKVRKVFL